jgi:hypothetical protein
MRSPRETRAGAGAKSVWINFCVQNAKPNHITRTLTFRVLVCSHFCVFVIVAEVKVRMPFCRHVPYHGWPFGRRCPYGPQCPCHYDTPCCKSEHGRARFTQDDIKNQSGNWSRRWTANNARNSRPKIAIISDENFNLHLPPVRSHPGW